MYFKTYEPMNDDAKMNRARAVMILNAVKRYCQTSKPTFRDYVAYCEHKADTETMFKLAYSKLGAGDVYTAWLEARATEWKKLKDTISKLGQPLRGKYVVYFGILDNDTVKNGETNNLPARFSTLNGEGGIVKLWYLEVENKEQALAAEHALHMLFDHVRCMNRVQNKKDYYECKQDAAERYFKQNMKTIYDAIMAEI